MSTHWPARKVLGQAEKSCFISKSLRAAVQAEPNFIAAPAAVAR